MLRNQLFGLLLVLPFVCCKGQQKATQYQAPKIDSVATVFPKVDSIDKYKATAFVPEISCVAPKNKNVIYTPTFLFAWDEVEHAIGAPIRILPGKPEQNIGINKLNTVNNATSYKGSLVKGEYDTKVVVTPGIIDITAIFKKSLEFAVPMQQYNLPFYFAEQQVRAFGMPEYNAVIAARIKVLYYKNDDTFIIKLLPKDATEEIVLAMGFNGIGTADLNRTNKLINTYTEIGKKESTMPGNEWKYNWARNESVVIPTLLFNIEASYSEFVGLNINGIKTGTWTIDVATQRAAFLLNENGAKLETEAHIVLTKSMHILPPGAPPFKKLLFNKPFTVLLRKNGHEHPYFMAKIENAELMIAN